jgi:hypothetical protein
MAGDEKDTLAARDGGIERVEAEDFNARIGAVHMQLVEMRVFGHDAAEIVPHGAHDGGDLGGRLLGEGCLRFCRQATKGATRLRPIQPPMADAVSMPNRRKNPITAKKPAVSR